MLQAEIAYERKTIPQDWSEGEKLELFRLRLEEGRDWAEIALALRRTESGVKSKFKYEQFRRQMAAPEPAEAREPVPDGVLREQARRIVAWGERTLTAAICGDPAPGFGAAASRKLA